MRPVPNFDNFRKLKAQPQRAVYWFCRNTQLDEGQPPVELVWLGPVVRNGHPTTQAVILREDEHFLTLRPDEIMRLADLGFVVEEDGVWKSHPELTWADWWVALEVEARLCQK